MAEVTSPQDARAKVWELIEQFRAAMLVTRSQAGQLSARPMAHMARPDANVVYILTNGKPRPPATSSMTLRYFSPLPMAGGISRYPPRQRFRQSRH